MRTTKTGVLPAARPARDEPTARGDRRPKAVPRAVRAPGTILVTALLLSGCSASSQPTGAPATLAAHPIPAATLAGPAAIPTPAGPKAASCTSSATPTTGAGVTIYQNPLRDVNNQVELVSAAGNRVLIDVGDPSSLSRPGGSNDILLTSHEPQDMSAMYEPDVDVDSVWVGTFPGRRVPVGGSVSTADFKIVGTQAGHGSTSGPSMAIDGTDSVEVIEVGGLRVAHFGDFGQPALTQKQLDRIGRVDVAITQLDNPFSGVTRENRLAYALIGQVCPRIVIPTGLSDDLADIQLAQTLLPVVYTSSKHVLLTPAMLPMDTTILLMGDRGAELGKELQLPASPW